MFTMIHVAKKKIYIVQLGFFSITKIANEVEIISERKRNQVIILRFKKQI
jgi:hypothetical protein